MDGRGENSVAELKDAADALREQVVALHDTVKEAMDVRDELKVITARTRSNTRLITAVIIGFALDVLMTVALVWMGTSQIETTNKLAKVAEFRKEAALCPLYKLFIDADTPTNRESAAKRGDDVQLRDQQFAIIREAYANLDCRSD
jgi:hypothetical protein